MPVSPTSPGSPLRSGPGREEMASRTSRCRLWADGAASWVVAGGGMAVVASILGILIFIVFEVAPLLRGAQVHGDREFVLSLPEPLAFLTDEHRSHAVVLAADGGLHTVDLASGVEIARTELQELDGGVRVAHAAPGQPLLTAATGGGRVVAVPIAWNVSFDADRRVVRAAVGPSVIFELDPDRRPLGAFAARVDDAGSGLAAAQLADGRLALVGRNVTENPITEEREETWSRHELPDPGALSALVLSTDGLNLFGGTEDGELVWWRIHAGRPADPQRFGDEGPAVTVLTLLIGDRSLVVGRADGGIGIWFPVRGPDETVDLTPIRDFPPLPRAVRLLAPSLRDKCFLAQDDSGLLGLYHSTSHRLLWTGPSPIPGASALFFTPKADGLAVAGAGKMALMRVHNPHPEVSLRALFGKVWYEGYERPDYVWQSTGGTDDFEPKLSLTPLLVGTLKGTFYSLIVAIPLGVAGAMYASQFMHPRVKHYVKPTVEIMAALPSVVLGFLAGLWLAPRMERVLPGVLLSLLAAPLAILIASFALRAAPSRWRRRLAPGSELALYLVALALTLWLCLQASPLLEALWLGGDFRDWLMRATGLRYDQRNAVVVGLAMGFAVIPFIFSIAEDAFSNVPRSLVSGSLALGADRWQTVTRVVLPTASPGIFSAIMIGFGRAVGETMIVLMATGNTPIMDWNPFNGFRTLSANIAVEIPEAPHGATLYRTLFLAALLLFALTFAVNTAGEAVRQRLRRRYAEL